MPTIKRFEDLECWQEARKLVKLIYSAIKANPEFQKDFRWSSSLFTHPTLPNHQSNLNDPNDQNDLNAPIEHKEKKLKNEI